MSYKNNCRIARVPFKQTKSGLTATVTEVTTDADSYLGRKVRNPGFPKQAGIWIKITNINNPWFSTQAGIMITVTNIDNPGFIKQAGIMITVTNILI